jgi:hypothetical protein
MFESKIEHKGTVQFPDFSGLRVMMLPFQMEDLDTLDCDAFEYKALVHDLIGHSTVKTGVAYLTIDEALVESGVAHRRPGMHVDGLGAWGGGGGAWARNGMLTASTVVGCRGWAQTFSGGPDENGGCDHMRHQCGPETVFEPNQVYWCGPLAVHESLPMDETQRRQFVRLSMPNSCDWYEGYTKNSMGVSPTGRVMPRRTFLDYRP